MITLARKVLRKGRFLVEVTRQVGKHFLFFHDHARARLACLCPVFGLFTSHPLCPATIDFFLGRIVIEAQRHVGNEEWHAWERMLLVLIRCEADAFSGEMVPLNTRAAAIMRNSCGLYVSVHTQTTHGALKRCCVFLWHRIQEESLSILCRLRRSRRVRHHVRGECRGIVPSPQGCG